MYHFDTETSRNINESIVSGKRATAKRNPLARPLFERTSILLINPLSVKLRLPRKRVSNREEVILPYTFARTFLQISSPLGTQVLKKVAFEIGEE